MNLFMPEVRNDQAAQLRVRNWIAALRSGNYPQANGRLRRDDAFCCLGVACDLYDPNAWKLDTLFWTWGDQGDKSLLPIVVRHAYRIRESNGELPPDYSYYAHGYTALDQANDSGASFKDIANIIERQLEEILHEAPATP